MLTNTFIVLVMFLFKDVAIAEKVDHGEYGDYHLWRKTVCEKKNQKILDDINECFLKEPPVIIKASVECIGEAIPEIKGIEKDFEKHACEDISLFKKFDECYAKYEEDEEFSEKAELSSENHGCYKAVVEKYDLKELLFYFEKESDDKKED